MISLQLFQDKVRAWLILCFGIEIAVDKTERCDRFIEEALELVQSVGYDLSRVEALVKYVGSRPPGEPHQELGGTMITLAALCFPHELSMEHAAEDEYNRINQVDVITKIRAKQAEKAKNIPFSPLP